MKDKILIPDWLRKEFPSVAVICEVMNEALKEHPDMSLAEFAEGLNDTHIRETYRRVSEAVKRQFNDDTGGNNGT